MKKTNVIVMLCMATSVMTAVANNENNNNKKTTISQMVEKLCATTKEHAHEAAQWTAERCDEMKSNMQEGFDQIKTRSKQFLQEAIEVIEKQLGSKRAAADETKEPQPARRILDEPEEHEMVSIQLPEGFGDEASQPAGDQPIVRRSRLEDVDGASGSWIEWLSSEQAKIYGKGAIALLTIGGITYVLYKNRIPQRIVRSATRTPLRTFVSCACLIGAAMYYAQQHDVTLSTLGNALTPQTP